MVRAHRRGGVDHAYALHGPGLVGGHVLPLDPRDTHHAVDLARRGRAASQNMAQGGSLAYLFHQLDGPGAVPELCQPGLHRDGDGPSGLNGVQAVVVAQPYQLGYGVEVVDAAVGAEGPVRLVLYA